MLKKASDILTEYFLLNNNIDPETMLEVEYVDAAQFLTPGRIDLICKLVYIDSKINDKNVEFARELYKEHIWSFSRGTFEEPGNENKVSIEDYFTTFDELIESLPRDGISAEKSAVPVGGDENILDGSHRTAIAIYFHLPLPIVRIPNGESGCNYRYFQSMCLNEIYLDYIAFQFLQWAQNCYVAVLWPVGDDAEKMREAEKILDEDGALAYKKRIKLNRRGVEQLVMHAYGHADWIGDSEDGFKGAFSKAVNCYKEDGVTTIYLLQGLTPQQVLERKERIREIYQLGKDSIHITDTKEEALLLAQEALNENSIHLLNFTGNRSLIGRL